MSEIELGGGHSGLGVVRVGDTVRRPPRFVTTTMRDVLQHLERVGFDAAPRWLGVDDQGRDILTWIEGDTFVERGRMHPYIGEPPDRILFDDAQLTAVFALLRRYHDTFDGEVICHGDYGPWNLVWRDGLPVAVIDFDSAYVGDPADDVGYALRMFVSYGFGPWTPEESVRRTGVALAAYGRGFDVPALLEAEYDRAHAKGLRNGWHRQVPKIALEREWLAANRRLFEIPLAGGRMTEGVVRVGDTVRKPSTFATQTMRDVLQHLERAGFDAAPRWLGTDEQGRDVLTWLEGDTLSDTGAMVFTDEQLAASAKLLRRYHDTFDGDVICHGDYGPWNLIWRDGEPAAIIDWDNAHAAPALDDVGYALWKFLNPGLVPVGWSEQRRRARVFLEAYGSDADPAAAIRHAQTQARERFVGHGWATDDLDEEIAWLRRYGSE